MTGSEDVEAWTDATLDELRTLLLRQAKRNAEPWEDFFFARLANELAELVGRASSAVNGGRLRLRDGHAMSHLVLDQTFRGQDDAVFRGVHFASDSRFMVSSVVQSWDDRMIALLQQGRLLAARRLVLYSDEGELLTDATRSLIREASSIPGYEHRALDRRAYQKELRAFDDDVPHDFGVYGGAFVFVAASHDPADLTGTWMVDPTVVDAYTQLFDSCWGSAKMMDPW